MFGLEIHANVVGNLIQHSWLNRAALETERLRLLVAAIAIASLGIFLTPGKSVPAIAVLTSAAIWGAYRSFAVHDYWCSGIGALLAASLVAVFISAFYFVVRTEGFRRYVQRTFQFELERKL